MVAINHNVLRQEITACLRVVEEQIEVVKSKAVQLDVSPYSLQDSTGGYVMVPLIVAKVNLYCALVDLNQKRSGSRDRS